MVGMVRGLTRHSSVVVALVVALTLAACGGDDPEPAAPAGGAGGGGGGAPETTALVVGVLPVVDVAPMYVAQQEGYFQQEGLTVTFQQMQGGAAILPAMVSGEVQVAFSNYVSLFLAKNGGIDLRVIAEGVRAKPGFSGVMTMPGSDITDAAGLAGKKVAVNTLNNIGDLIVTSTVQTAGGDPSTIEFVEIPLPEMGPTLERGDIDAAWVVEPFTTNLKSTLDAVSVADPYAGPTDKLPVAGYAVTSQFAQENPNTVAAFLRALTKAVDDIAADPAKIAQVVPTYTQITAEVAGQVVPPEYVQPQIDATQLQRVADLMQQQGKLPAPLDVSTFVNTG